MILECLVSWETVSIIVAQAQLHFASQSLNLPINRPMARDCGDHGAGTPPAMPDVYAPGVFLPRPPHRLKPLQLISIQLLPMCQLVRTLRTIQHLVSMPPGL